MTSELSEVACVGQGECAAEPVGQQTGKETRRQAAPPFPEKEAEEKGSDTQVDGMDPVRKEPYGQQPEQQIGRAQLEKHGGPDQDQVVPSLGEGARQLSFSRGEFADVVIGGQQQLAGQQHLSEYEQCDGGPTEKQPKLFTRHARCRDFTIRTVAAGVAHEALRAVPEFLGSATVAKNHSCCRPRRQT